MKPKTLKQIFYKFYLQTLVNINQFYSFPSFYFLSVSHFFNYKNVISLHVIHSYLYFEKTRKRRRNAVTALNHQVENSSVKNKRIQ